MSSNTPAIEKEIILISGGVESTTMLHMRHQTVTTALQHENARAQNPITRNSAKDLMVPLFINYGVKLSHSSSLVVSAGATADSNALNISIQGSAGQPWSLKLAAGSAPRSVGILRYRDLLTFPFPVPWYPS